MRTAVELFVTETLMVATPRHAGADPSADVARLRDEVMRLQHELARHVRTQEALRTSEAQWRHVVETMPQIVWITRPDGWHVHFNHKWMEFTGRTLDSSLGDGWIPAFHPDDRERAAARWAEATATGDPYEIEYRLRRADGVYHWMLGRAMPLRDATGTIVRWFGTCTDIEELKQAQARIDNQARLLDQTQDAIVVHSLDHRVTYWNQGAERIHGWTSAEATGRRLDELVTTDLAQVDAAVDVLLEHGEWSGELHYVDRVGADVMIEGRWSLLRNDDGTPRAVLAVNADVTQRDIARRKGAEREAAESRRAHQTDKLRAVGELTGGVAHDFNNLLLGISAFAELGQQRAAAGEDVTDALEQVAALVARGSELVRDLLAFARREEGHPEPTSLAALVDSLAPMVKRLISEDINLRITVPADLALVRGDHSQLERMVMNLILNARDAMPHGGTLSITAASTEAAGGEHWVQLEVVDTGVGMTDDVMERAFEPFFTTKPTGSGSGLGLAGVHGIVEAAGGYVLLDSEPGAGTRVTVYLPVSAGVAARGTPPCTTGAGALSPDAGSRSAMIMLVEDQDAIRDVLTTVLQRDGHRVVAVADGGAALAAAEAAGQPFDLVITDVVMPVLSGPELVTRLRRDRPTLPALLMSGYAADHMADVAHFDPVRTRYAAKPFNLDDLRTMVGELLALA